MFQSFDATTKPSDGPPRLARLRGLMAAHGLDGYLVPRADAHQGEWVAERDERLAWLTGFSGSAGFCAVTPQRAGVFVDGRYRIQVKDQIDTSAFAPVDWPETKLEDWLRAALPEGGTVGFDPWLHTRAQLEKLVSGLKGSGVRLCAAENLVDRIWSDRPEPPSGRIIVQPDALAGRSSGDKRAALAAGMAQEGAHAAILTLPDSIAWLLNIRGSDIAHMPVALAYAILGDDGRLRLFVDPAKCDDGLRAHLGPEVTIKPPAAFEAALAALTGPVRIDRATAPERIAAILEDTGIAIDWAADPCLLPKACKSAAEIAGARAAHMRDGVAMAEFLAWLAALGPDPQITEIDVVERLETFRRASNALVDISFETIAGTGPNGAINHYRVTRKTNRPVKRGDLLLVDSGGQYRDGTTDITRTVAIGGTPSAEERACFTRVLQGMIAISTARWPKGLAGRDLDPLARQALWRAGQDFDHGTGHGVGSFLGVHEGPQRISRLGEVPLEAGMILSNEPGYYREGAFGIRIENLLAVIEAPAIKGADARPMLAFETLAFTPIDRNLIEAGMLSRPERDWLNAYHRETLARIGPHVGAGAAAWLAGACAPL